MWLTHTHMCTHMCTVRCTWARRARGTQHALGTAWVALAHRRYHQRAGDDAIRRALRLSQIGHKLLLSATTLCAHTNKHARTRTLTYTHACTHTHTTHKHAQTHVHTHVRALIPRPGASAAWHVCPGARNLHRPVSSNVRVHAYGAHWAP